MSDIGAARASAPARWTHRAVWIDVALGLFVSVAVALTILADLATGAPGTRDADLGAYGFAVSLGLLMLVRRRAPVVTLVVTLCLLALYHKLDYPPIGVAVPAAAALYSIAERGRLGWAIGGAAVYLTGTTAVRSLEGDERLDFLYAYELMTAVTLSAAVIAFGEAVRARRGWQAETRRRAALARIEQEQEAARRVEQERVRIARELHDVLAHTVSVISIQADVAAESVVDDPGAALGAIGAIRSASSDALTELRTTLRVLRNREGPAPRSPVGGLTQLDRIVGTAAESGLAVSIRVVGEWVPLPAVVDAAAHRIVQESVTNVLRHARAGAATVELRYDQDTLTVRVADDGCGPAARSGPDGYGIRGMQERVAILGGVLRTGPRDEGGFLVEATLPIGGPA